MENKRKVSHCANVLMHSTIILTVITEAKSFHLKLLRRCHKAKMLDCLLNAKENKLMLLIFPLCWQLFTHIFMDRCAEETPCLCFCLHVCWCLCQCFYVFTFRLAGGTPRSIVVWNGKCNGSVYSSQTIAHVKGNTDSVAGSKPVKETNKHMDPFFSAPAHLS